MVKKRSIEIHLHTNYSCNLFCKHCYNNSNSCNSSMLQQEYVFDLIRKICNIYNVEIHLEGGEIFLLPKLLAEMNTLPVKALKCITITTNGTIQLTDFEVLEMLSKIKALRVSVEGHTNEQQRAIRNTDLTPVLDNARFYKKNNIPVWLRVTLHKNNYEAFVKATLPALNSEGFENIQVYEFQNVGRGNDNHADFEIGASIGHFLESLEENHSLLKGNIRMLFPEKRISEILDKKNALLEKGYKLKVLEPRAGISIHADGQVYLCAWENDPEKCIMNICETGVDTFLERIETMDLIHQCSHCSAIGIVKKD